MDILADYGWKNSTGHFFGIYIWAENRQLAGLEVWSVDGEETPMELPPISELYPMAETQQP